MLTFEGIKGGLAGLCQRHGKVEPKIELASRFIEGA